ncbi:MAG: Synechococcus phage, partial [Candidatus Parcubacteria bacterium]
MNKIHKGTRKGFTILEILLVITLIGILSTIALVAINPNRQLAQARNLKRKSDINAIYNALEKYTVRNRGNTYPGITFTLQEICNTGTRSTTDDLPDTNYCEGKADLRALVPTYIAAIPVDPQGGAYRVSRNSDNNRISVTAPGAELSQTIAINPPPPKFVATSCTYTDKKISIPYTAGEVGYNYASQTINSTGVTGLTATLTSGTLSASGTLEYEVTGTPSGVGTANFDFSNIGNTGVGCNNSNIAVNVIEVLDSNYNNVALLINGNGTNGSTSIIDSSSNSNTVTAFGNSQISNAQSKFGGSSIYFDGSGDYLNIGYNGGAFDFGSSDWTVEFWIYLPSLPNAYKRIYS